MLRKLRLEDGRDSTNAAARIWVVLVRTRDPFSAVLLDVDLARNVVESEMHGWHDRYGVYHVVDALDTVGKNAVHEAREDLVTNPGHTVPDDSDVGG